MVKIGAGSFSTSVSESGELYIWGEGTFGKFEVPHKIKSGSKFKDVKVSNNFAATISETG